MDYHFSFEPAVFGWSHNTLMLLSSYHDTIKMKMMIFAENYHITLIPLLLIIISIFPCFTFWSAHAVHTTN